MNGWMFFSTAEKRGKNISRDFEVMLEAFPGVMRLSREEWNTFFPESKEPLQGASLGFWCGSENGKIPDGPVSFPMRSFVSDWVVMPSCWTYRTVLTARPSPETEYRVVRIPTASLGITVTGSLPDKPPAVRVYGSYCFFPPPYIFPGNFDLTF